MRWQYDIFPWAHALLSQNFNLLEACDFSFYLNLPHPVCLHPYFHLTITMTTCGALSHLQTSLHLQRVKLIWSMAYLVFVPSTKILALQSDCFVGVKYTYKHELYVTDIAWQSVPYGLYSTESEGHSPDGEGCISCTAHDRHAICIIYPKGGGVFVLLTTHRRTDDASCQHMS